MPCGKRPLVKEWDKSRNIRVVKPSIYEQNEASVKMHWKKVIRDLELSYKDEQFWESQSETVRGLVGPTIYYRIAKIFNLPFEAKQYVPQSDLGSIEPSELYYKTQSGPMATRQEFSMSDFTPSAEEEVVEEESEQWSVSSVAASDTRQQSKAKSVGRLKSLSVAKSTSKHMSKSFSKFLSKTLMKSYSNKSKSTTHSESVDESAATDDDLEVHHSLKPKRRFHHRRGKNPHFEMLYCNDSETDMIKWNSKYKQKTFEVSASDEFSKKAEIMTKKIALEFYEWWVGLGNLEFKSEIKRPEDIEDLFQILCYNLVLRLTQVWFDEHASRGLVLHPKILPCVLQSIAEYVQVPRAACANVLGRQIAYDIHAETSPAHLMAFGTCLPHKMKHIPPMNNTKEQWHCVKIPEDLRSMACVWEDVQHLTSTKAFNQWLKQRPHLPMPPCFTAAEEQADKKQLFVVPSDFVVKEGSATSSKDLALPVSQFSMELKEVLSKLMNQ